MICRNNMTKKDVLKQYFGYDHFREGQDYLIDKMIEGCDVVGVMPTGAGKSICFQIPAMLFEGITLVISPLISLMQDQTNALTQVGIQAAFLNSSLTQENYRFTIKNAQLGKYKLIYVAPERLLSVDFLEFAQQTSISMITIDEAHCISQWGQDFRPSYLKISTFINTLKKRPIISAFTATATKMVREDIINALRLKNPEILVTGFNRKNLYFEVQRPKNKFSALLAIIEEQKNKNGIIYCSTRKHVEEVTHHLCDLGFSATRYHAGLSDQERKENQNNFIFDRQQIMVATNAFGMGIDKSNVSFVVHYNMPKSLEHYYQEAGRAGRDGENARCILLYNAQDVRTNLFLIDNNQDSEPIDSTIKEQDRERLKQITFYCTTNDCLREFILKYFGEKTSHFCGNCYNCNTHFETVSITIEAQKILSCIRRIEQHNGQHYGISMICDILRGTNNEKIKRLRLDTLSTYNIMPNISKKDLSNIISFLALQGYAHITNDGFPVVTFGSRAKSVLFEGEQLQMKRVKPVVEKPLSKTELKTTTSYTFNPLFMEKLKALRLSIANQQGVPAFVIFSDASLTDMCMKLPQNESEFLEVSGVGQIKLARYGQLFLKEIRHFLNNSTQEKTVLKATKTTKELTEFFCYLRENIDILEEEPISISQFVQKVNSVVMIKYPHKLLLKNVSNWLVLNDYLQEELNEQGKYHKMPTEKGFQIGIISELRVGKEDTPYNINMYNKNAAQFLLDNLEELFCLDLNTFNQFKHE